MDSYVAEIPENMEVKAFDKTEGPMVQIQKTRFTKNTTINPNPIPVNLKEMKHILASI